MILEIDAGNSRLKWRYLADGAGTPGPVSECNRDGGNGFPEEWRKGLDRVRVAAVVSDADALAREIASWTGVEPEFAQTRREQGGVINSYADPARMGVDRWLAMLAARARAGGSCCVIDAGTAITIDGLGQGGRHLGGYIVPGLRMMETALLQGTGQIRVESRPTPGTAPGDSTEAAVLHGVMLMAVAFVERALDTFAADCGEQPQTFLTGGDAAVLGPHLGREVMLEPGLVLDGLAIAIP